jgi:hypothetical protein
LGVYLWRTELKRELVARCYKIMATWVDGLRLYKYVAGSKTPRHHGGLVNVKVKEMKMRHKGGLSRSVSEKFFDEFYEHYSARLEHVLKRAEI